MDISVAAETPATDPQSSRRETAATTGGRSQGFLGPTGDGVVTSTTYEKRSGADARIGVGGLGSTTRALSRAIQRTTNEIFFPYIGLEFDSTEEAKNFYNLYSWEVGFGITTGRSDENNNGYKTHQDYYCSCEIDQG
ncbi:hypothetical protein ACP70R_004002 [Stipagrostis hirtigluma subsp. patula]